ncbi:hypothetical protein FOTG_07803 [Fusarium oxysporum f. sp. vasinfectum 25433]|uniref:Branchpoint-bridging protein n=1 Tax=Fusarium oxysporum f. sp. vasinfectum 25433 TaxID=1089449 RepID=X0LHC4_FUSOX|nr:hypothetical protein FOTG_07803 [Fusarium oxysporum f. sp. vasinfectum 25433]
MIIRAGEPTAASNDIVNSWNEREREQLVQAALKTIPAYRPPYDYRWKRETFTDKIYLPVADFPYVPFIGQILWPRGSSLKAINDQSGANVVTRGKGNRDSPSHCQRLQRTPSLFDHCGLTIQSRPSQKGHSRRDCNSHYDTGSRQ